MATKTGSGGKGGPEDAESRPAGRRRDAAGDRRAEALRANLRRRKDQARGREAPAGNESPEGAG